jgi:hypothetical protein
MNVKFLIIVAGLLFSGAAIAAQCPADMKKIDQALEAGAANISEEQRAEVERLRAEGEELHQAGEHQASMDALAQAKAILGVED